MADREMTAGGYEEPDRGKVEKAKDKAKSKAKEKLSSVAHQGEELVEEGKEKAREVGDRATRIARSRADEQRERVAGGMRTVADALRQSGRDLPEDRQQYGRLLDGVADRVEGASRYLEEHDVDSMTRDVRRVARDHTPAFLSGAFTLGLIGARVLKSSSDQVRDDRFGRDIPRTGSAGQLTGEVGGYETTRVYSAEEYGTTTGIDRGTVGPDYNELERGIDRAADDVGAEWDELPGERGNV